MTQLIFDLRIFAVLFLLVAVIVLVVGGGWGVAEPGAAGHDAGFVTHPTNDCGDNFFKIFITPKGDECFVRGDSAQRVEAEMQKQDPSLFDESIDYVPQERWTSALERALTALGW